MLEITASPPASSRMLGQMGMSANGKSSIQAKADEGRTLKP